MNVVLNSLIQKVHWNCEVGDHTDKSDKMYSAIEGV